MKKKKKVGETAIVLSSVEIEKPSTVIDVETTYQSIKQLRIDGKHKECMDLLNTFNIKDNPIYLWKIYYEYTIIAFYVGIKNINDKVVTILNLCDDYNVISNLMSNLNFYPNILKSYNVHDLTHSIKHKINDIEYNFNSSSSCIIKNSEEDYLLNVRFVNYNITKNGRYNDCEKYIISINKYYELNKDFSVTREKLIDIDFIDKQYMGIEDIRIFKNKDNVIQFIGTGYHEDNIIGIKNGLYNIELNKLVSKEIKPAFNIKSNCEKNWVYFDYKGETHVIYSWFPLKICKIDEKYSLLMYLEEKSIPLIFKYARGSTCGFTYNTAEIWFVVHLVSYETPRNYYHMLAVFDENMKIKRYTAPFKFEGENIEYCLGLIVEKDRVIMTYSTWDRTTKIAIYNKKYIDGLTIY